MESSDNITAGLIKPFGCLPLGGGLGMDMEMAINTQNNRGRRPAATTLSNPKKKRRATAKAPRSAKYPAAQDLLPPISTGHGDTIIVSNPFDDAPRSMNNGGSQHFKHFNGPQFGSMGVMAPMINIMDPATIPHNTSNIRPFGNQENRIIGNPCIMGTGHIGTMNNMMNNLPNGLMMNMKMDPMKNHGIGGASVQINPSVPFNNHMINGPRMNSVNIMPPIRPLVINNLKNKPPNHKISQYESNFIGNNEMGNVGRLMNMHISHQNQTAMTREAPLSSKKNNGAPSMGFPVSPSNPHSNLQTASDMGPRSHSSEKTYPADQPMIFNAQNPHAPPIYPCGICHKEVSDHDQGVICESGCNFWFHRSCLGLSEAAFQLLTREIYAEWVCDNCLRSKNIPVIKFKQ